MKASECGIAIFGKNVTHRLAFGRFATTIHVLVSATMKISRAQRVPSGLKLYRGLGGMMELPEGFYRADDRGCRGCMEWGFLSTTSDKHAALEVCCSVFVCV